MAVITPGRAAAPDPARSRLHGWQLAGFVLVLALGVFPVLSAALDLAADSGTGLPSDHAGTFTSLAGASWPHAQAVTPGVARYVTLLERGYALHELTFALLFVAIIAVPFRRRQRWAWWAAWIPLIANLGYTFSFGVHDHSILVRSLIADIALPVLLLAHIPAFFGGPFGTKVFHAERGGCTRPLRCHFCRGVPSPPVQAPPYSGVYFGEARNVFTNCCSRGSDGELTLSWNPQEEMTTGAGSPGYGVRSMYREGAPSAEGSTVCFCANARSWSTSEAGSEGR